MYWDTLTATGVLASIVSTLAAFYLVWRAGSGFHRDDLRET